MTFKTAWIVLAEDNRADVFLIREALNREGLSYRLSAIEDGDEMLRLIEGLESETQAPCPDLLVLDLNLPKRSGPEILARLRASSRCAGISVIAISSSETPRDWDKIKTRGTKYYFQKPSDLKEFLKFGRVVRAVLERDSRP
jgi:CheY-like chemotaxis protein